MLEFNQDEIKRRLGTLSGIIKESFYSYDFKQILFSICDDHHLSRERALGVMRSLAYLLLGLIYPKDLPTSITKEAGIDPRISSQIAQEIDHKMILPALAAELNRVYGFKMDIVDVPTITTHSIQPEISIQTPSQKQEWAQESLRGNQAFVVPVNPPTTTPEVSPLIIHETTKEERIPVQAGGGYAGGLVHPNFYSQISGEHTVGAITPTARVEMGGGARDNDEPTTTKIGGERARVVHYDAPEVSPDPFSQAPKTIPAVSRVKDVSPANIVNLKDLPQ